MYCMYYMYSFPFFWRSTFSLDFLVRLRPLEPLCLSLPSMEQTDSWATTFSKTLPILGGESRRSISNQTFFNHKVFPQVTERDKTQNPQIGGIS